MIYLNQKEFSETHFGGKAVSAIYNGALLVWQAIKSCFGAGYWKNSAPWSNSEGWKNN
jgi:hypothetical protein